MPSRLKKPSLPWIFALPPIAVSLAFFVLPYFSALALSLNSLGTSPSGGGFLGGGGGGEGGFGGWGGLPPNLLKIIVWTFEQAVLSAGIALLIGIPAAYIAGSPGFKHRGLARTLTSIPFAMPSILFVLGFILFWGNSGYFHKILPVQVLYKPSAIIFAHACFNFPLVMQFSQGAFYKIRKSYAFCAASLGASPLQRFFTVVLPLAAPSIASAAILAFLYCWTSFAMVLILGGGPAGTTLAVEIYRYARITLNYRYSGLLSLIETSVACFAFLFYLRFEKKNKYYFPAQSADGRMETAAGRNGKSASGKAWGILKNIYFILVVLLLLAPLASIIYSSFFVPSSRGSAVFGFNNYYMALGNIAAAALRSILLAFVSSLLSCALAVFASEAVGDLNNIAASGGGSERKAGFLLNCLKFCTVSPIAASGIVLSLGFISLYGRGVSRGIPALVIMHSLISLPFAYNAVRAASAAIPKSVLDAALVFGSSPFKRLLSVNLPLIKDRMKSVFGFCACISIGELNCIMMLGTENWETLPLLIYRAVSAYRYNLACAAGAVLILCCLAALSSGGTKHSRNSRFFKTFV